MSDATLAALITAAGGVLLSVVTWFLSKGKTKVDFATQIRDELRKDIERWQKAAEGFEKKARELYKEVEEMREKNFELEKRCNTVEDKNTDLEREVERLKKVLHDNKIDGF